MTVADVLPGGKIRQEMLKGSWGCIDVVSASTGEYAKRYGFIY